MRPADALAFPRMTFQRRTGARKSRVQFQGPFFRHFQTTLFRHGPTVPVCSRGPISPVQTSTAGHVRHVPGDSDIKTPVNAALLRSGAAQRRLRFQSLGTSQTRRNGRSKARATHCGIQQAAPYSVFRRRPDTAPIVSCQKCDTVLQ